jgi:glutaredoxin
MTALREGGSEGSTREGMIIIYCLEDCPRCEEIKAKLTASGYEYREEDMSTAENITEMRLCGCFAMEAPVLRVGDNFFEYCQCQADGFFSEMFGVKQHNQTIPDVGGKHWTLKQGEP